MDASRGALLGKLFVRALILVSLISSCSMPPSERRILSFQEIGHEFWAPVSIASNSGVVTIYSQSDVVDLARSIEVHVDQTDAFVEWTGAATNDFNKRLILAIVSCTLGGDSKYIAIREVVSQRETLSIEGSFEESGGGRLVEGRAVTLLSIAKEDLHGIVIRELDLKIEDSSADCAKPIQ